jgi:hypothetical protein
MTQDPWLAALLDQYMTTLLRLQRSFVGPWPASPSSPLERDEFIRRFTQAEPGDLSVAGFVSLQSRARRATGQDGDRDDDPAEAYSRYVKWLDFDHRRNVVLRRVSARLGYEVPDVKAVS